MANVLAKNDPSARNRLVNCLLRDSLAISPCDTIYGILGVAPGTREKIRDLKGRSENKPFIELQPSVEAVTAATTASIPKSLLALWPGPLTLVVPTGTGTTGFRVPADPFLLGVLDAVGSIFSTSVNFAGSPSLWRISDIITQFGDLVDLIIDGGDLETGVASTVLDISSSPYRVLRAGAAILPDEVIRLCEA